MYDEFYDTRSKRGSGTIWLMLAAFGLLGIAGASWYAVTAKPALDKQALEAPRPVAPKTEHDSEEKARIKFFKDAKGSVVNVDIVLVQRNMFDRKLIERPFGTGSGIVWNDAGNIVTNLHVVREAIVRNLSIRVILADRSSWKAELVGFDEDNDLAVLKIDADKSKLKAVSVGSSHDLEVGQTVYAIGNPFGQSLTLTQGIISAVDREIESQSDSVIRGAIQTDAALNPGNSGGPLFDKDGRLIGVNTAIKTPSGGSVGIGFAIPVDTVNNVVPKLIRDGRVIKPTLGIVHVREDVTRRAGFDKGVMIFEVKPNSSASDAGLQGVRKQGNGDLLVGDIIISVDDKPISDFAALQKMLRARKIGDVVKLKIIRDGKNEKDVEATLKGD